MAGKKKPVTTWTLADLGIEPAEVGAAGFGAGAALTCGAAVWGMGSPLLTVIFKSPTSS